MVLPNSELLNQIQQRILQRPNKPEESKKLAHYGLFLLCSQAGLRVSEAVSFDLTNQNKQGLYKISPTKKRAKRYVYIPKQVISELKKNNWKPNQTNRFNFYHFLKRIKQELDIPRTVELTPHSLRRCFATQWANGGMPLPLLSKMLGHASIRTTALYWLNIYQEPEQSIKPPSDDITHILLGKEWIEKQRPSQPSQPEPIKIGEISEPVITNPSLNQPTVQAQVLPNSAEESFSLNELVKAQLLISNKSQPEKEPLSAEPKPTPILTEILVEKDQEKFSEPAKPIISESNPEQVLLSKVQQLAEQLKQVQAENEKLKAEKERAEALAQQEKNRADYYEQQLKALARSLYQWQKINYYQQQEKAEQKCFIVQAENLPPFRLEKQ